MNNEPNTPRIPLQARKMARWLGWGGILPFLALAMVSAWKGPEWAHTPLIVYAMLILAFMAGAHWFAVVSGHRPSANASAELVLTNILVLGAWPAILMPTAWACIWLAVLFVGHLFLDAPWRHISGPAWYRHMRLGLSTVVITALMLGGLIGLGLQFNQGQV